MRAVAPLVMATTDNDWRVRDASVLALGFFNKTTVAPALPAVLARLADEQIKVRRSAALTMGRLGKESSGGFEALRALEDDPDELLRLNVFLALQKVGKTEPEDLPRLLDALENPENSTSEMAMEILKARINEFSQVLKPRLALLLENHSQELVNKVLSILNNLTDRDEMLAQELVRVLPGMDMRNRVNTMKLISRMDVNGQMALQVCVECLRDSDPILVKEGLICAMKYRQSFQQYNALIIPLLNHEDEETKILAISLIRGTCKTATDCVSTLIELLDDPSYRVRFLTLSTLGTLAASNDKALDALSRTLKHQDERLRLSCVSVLKTIGQQKNKKVIPILQKALQAPTDEKTRRNIAAAIKELKGVNSLIK